MYNYKAKVHRVVDGDTIDLVVDLGFHVNIVERFRLVDINAPERGQAGWSEATKYFESLVSGKELIVYTTKKDGFRRWLANIYLRNDTESINQKMLIYLTTKNS